MNRAIKFRAFWSDTKKPVKDFMGEYVLDALNDKSFIIQQFAGLLDSKGREIFEGDILTDGKDRYVCKFRTKAGSSGFYLSCIRVNEIWDFGGGTELLTIVGNIFENPELLEWKKCEFVDEYNRSCNNEVKRLAVNIPCCEEHAKIREQSFGIYK